MLKRLAYRFSSFSVKVDHKRALKEFYRNVHPDIIQSAPKRVKEENLRSIQTLNDYLDRVKKNAGCGAVRLKFYAPEKDNLKSRRYYFFETSLDQFNANSDLEYLSLLEKRVISKLVSNLKATQYYNNPASEKLEKKNFTDKIIEDADLQEEKPDLFVKSSSKRAVHQDLHMFKKSIMEYEKKANKEEVMKEIQKHLYIFYDDLAFKDYYGEQIYEELTYNYLERKIGELGVELKLFYIKEGLDEGAVFDFFKRFYKKMKKTDFDKTYFDIQKRLFSCSPKVKILIGERFKQEKGFIEIDVTDDIIKSMAYIDEQISVANEDRENIMSEDNLLEKARKELQKMYGLQLVDFSEFDGEQFSDYESSHTKKFLFLRKLDKLLKNRKNLLTGYRIILSQENELNKDINVIRLRWNYKEKDILALLNPN